MNKPSLLFCALGLASLSGCPSSNSPADVGVDTRPSDHDTGTVGEDTGSTVLDTGTVVEDTGSTVVDTGSAIADTGPLPDAGMCADLPPSPTRPVPVTCSPCRPPGGGTSSGPGECRSDADCTEGDNGRCVFGRAGASCSYDECFSDADCGANEVCLCDGSGLGGGGNSCITTSCRTNNDCGGQTCSPTFGSCGHYTGVVSYACHTASDECTVDSDCGAGYCAFDAAVSHWVCSTMECVG